MSEICRQWVAQFIGVPRKLIHDTDMHIKGSKNSPQFNYDKQRSPYENSLPPRRLYSLILGEKMQI
jgi:hypothetical protein